MSAPNELSEPAAPIRDGGLAGSSVETRLRLDLGYDGTDFAGWARQPQLRTVAQVVEGALATVLRLDEPPMLTVAGRTDAGVHATGQVAHVDVPAKLGAALPEPIDVEVVSRRLAGVLPDDVVLHRLQLAPAGFHARFSALGRRYVYRVADRGANPLRRHDTVSWPRPLDPGAMQHAALGLHGEHDFAAYCRPRAGATTIRTLHEMRVTRDSEDVLLIAAHADAFCHSQIRSMVGALLAVGEGRRPIDWPGDVLGSGVRNSLVNVAPAHGLTLIAVDYPPDSELAARVSQTRQRRQRRP